ncbi:MAG TPA: HAMP domain-containing sensor histidine kinase [Anaeromyxobacteraceae bacterium]|nr:HAMP domain-containing sensor histidine kinase [Anaeromyxobacteraceae bacterium]
MSHRHGRERRLWHGSLFRRVVLHGLLLLFLVALAVGIAGWALGRSFPVQADPRGAMALAAERAAELWDDPARLRAELVRVRERLGVDAAAFAPGGRVVASGVEPPPPLPPEVEARAADGPVHVRGRGLTWAAPIPGGRGTLVASASHRSPPLVRAALFLGAVLVALALGSLPLARSIAAPLERLTRTARALGRGDLSARAGVEAGGEVGELSRAFDEMAERLERLVRGERELLANVSHEIRTPLARIRVALELAAEGDLERARRYLGEIGADLSEMDRLVEAVLATARLDAARAGGLPLRRERVDLAALAREAAERFRAEAPDRELDLSVEGGLPEVEGDPDLLRRLLANLLDNARKYSEAPAAVGLSVRGSAEGAVVEVRDRGIGIEAADLPRLFTPFFRTDRSRARGTGGVGLGLALARRIAEAHGGSLSAESVAGVGTTMRIVLPPFLPSTATARQGP